jgi:hypothetical protein
MSSLIVCHSCEKDFSAMGLKHHYAQVSRLRDVEVCQNISRDHGVPAASQKSTPNTRAAQNLSPMDEETADVFYLADFDESEDGQDMPGLLGTVLDKWECSRAVFEVLY